VIVCQQGVQNGKSLGRAGTDGVLQLQGIGVRIDHQGLVGDLEGFGCGGLVGAGVNGGERTGS